MKSATLILNMLLISVLGLASAATQMKVRNHYLQYSTPERNVETLPLVSQFTVRYTELAYGVPLLWAVVSIVVWMRLSSATESKRADFITFHTTASLFIGVLLLFVFSAGGIFPFMRMELYLSGG